MTASIHRFLIPTWHMLAGLLIGALLMPIAYREWDAWRDSSAMLAERGTPVIQSSGRIVERSADSVVVHITGEKLRDCKIVGIQGFSLNLSGVMTAASIVKLTAHLPQLTDRPVGPFDAGFWRIWPVSADARKVRVYVLHACNGVEVRSILAEVALDDAGR